MKRRSLVVVIFGIFFLNITGILAEAGYSANTNICQTLKHHPNWQNSLKKADKKYDISPAFTLAVIHQESKFHANAKNRHSSAFGYAQVLNGTWKVFQKDVEPNAKRNNFNDSVEFVDWYMARLALDILPQLKQGDS